MIKTLLFGLNVLGLLLIGFFQNSEVEITHNPPASLAAGQEAVVEVLINKSDVSGFAKFQISIDEGLTIENIESSGASFTFNENKAKFIWMSLPDAKKFVIKYRVVADANALGNLKLDSRFSYIYENDRKNYDLPTHNIAVGDPSALVAQQIKSSIAAKASNNSASVTGERVISPAGVNQWKVDLTIQKSDLQGFAKIEETIPNGYTVIDLKSSDAVFSLEDKKLKYIWYNIPDNETINVSYKMLPLIAMDGVRPNITGDFSYLKDEETITIPIGSDEEILANAVNSTTDEIDDISETVEDTKEDIADETENIEEKTEEIIAETTDTVENKTEEIVEKTEEIVEPETPIVPKTETPKSENKNDLASTNTAKTDNTPKTEPKTTSPTEPKKTVEPKATTPPKSETKTNETAVADNTSTKGKVDANIVNVPEPEKGVYYRVQIAAGKNNLKSDVFTKLYNFSEGYKIEYLGSWWKYTTGYHQVYKSARDGRERIKAKYDKFQGPFVAAYNDGERITVQEALMITSQKWFQ